MDAWIQIGLFDRDERGNRKEVLSLFREWDIEGIESHEDLEKLFEGFVKMVRAENPKPSGKFDIYITFYPGQESFVLPKSFFDLIHETGWEVNLLLNTR